MSVAGILVLVLMALSILLIPLGLPGLWILTALVVVGAWLGEVSWWIVWTAVGLTAVAELAEWVIVHRMNEKYGGSAKAFWAAVGGGILGVVVGAPIPIIGSIVAGLVGSFAGAALMTYHELEDVGAAGRVGWGVVVARTFAVGVKVAAAVVVLVLGGGAWVLR